MEIKVIFRRIIIMALIIYIGFLLQTSVFSHFELAGVCPNILVTITASFGFMKGRRKGMIVGFFCGLVLDIFSGNLFGLMALIYMYIGYINGFFKKMFFGDDLKLPLVLVGASDLIYGLFMYLVNSLISRSTMDIVFYIKDLILPEMVYTVLVAIFVYYIILKIDSWLDKVEKKRGYSRVEGSD